MAFNRANNPSPPTTAPAFAAPINTTLYSGIQLVDRDPMLPEGTYRIRITDVAQGSNPKFTPPRLSHKIYAVITQVHSGSAEVGSPIFISLSIERKGLADLLALTMAGAGCGVTLEDVHRGATKDGVPIIAAMRNAKETFDALEAQYGGAGSIVVAGMTKAEGVPNIIGEEVDVIVTRGKDRIDKATGEVVDWYRQYRWCVVPQQ
jgi:hypothetical protein